MARATALGTFKKQLVQWLSDNRGEYDLCDEGIEKFLTDLGIEDTDGLLVGPTVLGTIVKANVKDVDDDPVSLTFVRSEATGDMQWISIGSTVVLRSSDGYNVYIEPGGGYDWQDVAKYTKSGKRTVIVPAK